jgi:hypothetical protein
MQFASDNIMWIPWRYAEAVGVPNLPHTNVIGSFVTAGALIHLYGYLGRLGDRALYCETDYIIFVQPRERPSLGETGDSLGAMNTELTPNRHSRMGLCRPEKL